MPSSYTPAIATPVTPPNGGTGVTNNAASTLTISGNFGTTFTVSGATALTLPTSGTVATTATFASPPALGSGTPAAVTGTTVTATTKFVAPKGSDSAPGISGSNGSNTGMELDTAAIYFSCNGGYICSIDGNGVTIGAGQGLINNIGSNAQILVNKTITAGGTTGAQQIDKVGGSVNFAAGATSLIVTCNKCTVNSIILVSVASNDTTMKGVHYVPGAGSFTLYPDVAPTSETAVRFYIFN